MRPCVLALLAVALLPAPRSRVATAGPPAPACAAASAARVRVEGLQLLGEARIAPGSRFEGTVVGGLSGLCYDPASQRYLALSDDRSQTSPARFYTLRIDAADGGLGPGGAVLERVTTLTDREGRPFPARSLDPEGIALARDGQSVFISSEGDPRIGQPPWIKQFGRDGREQRTLELPERYLAAPAGQARRGVRANLGFEALTLTPDGATLVTAVESALEQDGPEAGLDRGTRCRILSLGAASGRPLSECVVDLEPVAQARREADGLQTNGLPDLLALDDAGTFLMLERSFSAGAGVTVRLYELSTAGASDTSPLAALARPDGSYEPVERPASKRLLLSIGDLRWDGRRVVPDNIEALCLGPALPDGRRLLLLLSDDNFNPLQVTQLLAFALRLGSGAASSLPLPAPSTVPAR